MISVAGTVANAGALRRSARALSLTTALVGVGVAVAIGALPLIPTAARAASTTWTGATDSTYGTDANWTNNHPAATDDATFDDSGAAGPVDLGPGATFDANSWTIDAATNSYVIGGGTATINLTTGLINSSSANQKVDVIIGGGGSLTQSGTGTLTLTGANTYSGGTTINAGTITLNGVGATLGSGAVAINGGALRTNSDIALANTINTVDGGTATFGAAATHTLTLNAAANGTVAGHWTFGSATDTGTVVFGGGGGLLNGGLTIEVAGGTLREGGQLGFVMGSSGTSTTIVDAGATLDMNNQDTTINNLQGVAGATVTTGTGNLTIKQGDYGGDITAASLTKTTTDTLLLSGDVDLGAGALTVSGGTLALSGAGNSFGSIGVGGGTLRLLTSNAAGGATITTTGSVISYADAVNDASPIVLSSNTTQLEVFAGDSAEQSGLISETGGSRPIEKTGAGTLLISNSLNSYTGGTSITAGTLEVNAASLGTGGILFTGNSALRATANVTLANGVYVGAGFSPTISAAAGTTLTLAGVYSYNPGGVGTVMHFGTAADTGTVVMDFTGFAYPTAGGDTAIDGGTVGFGSGAAALNTFSLPSTSTLTIASGAALDTGGAGEGNSVDVANLAGAGTVTNSTANNVTLGVLNGGSFSGVIQDGTNGGTNSLRKFGAGTLTLSGVNTYTGFTTVSGGTLALSGAGSIANSVPGVFLGGPGGDFDISGVTGAGTSIQMLSGGVAGGGTDVALGAKTLTLTNGNGGGFDGEIGGTGGLTLSGGSITLTGANTYTGDTTVGLAAGTLTVSGSVAGDVVNAATFALAGGGDVGGAVTNNFVMNVTGVGEAVVGGLLTNNVSLNVNAGSTLTASAGITNAGGGSITNDGVINDDLSNAGLVNNNGSYNADISSNTGTINNNVGATWTGDVADGANTGTINNNNVWNGNVLGPTGNAGTIANDGNWNGSIVNSATLTAVGQINGDVTNNNGGTFSVVGALSGIGLLTNNGTTDLGGNSGIIVGGIAGTDSTATIGNGGGLAFGGDNASRTYAGRFTGSGTFDKNGTGTQTLTGANGAGNQFTGTFNIGGGTLQVDGTLGDTATNAATVNVNAGGTLSGTGHVDGDVNVLGGTLAAGHSPGTLVIGGNLVLNGASTSNFELGQAGFAGGVSNDLVQVGGTATLGGTLNLTNATGGQIQSGYYQLIQAGGGASGSFATVNAGTATANVYTTTGAGADNVNALVNAPGQFVQFWDGSDETGTPPVDGGSGTWDNARTNWTGNAAGDDDPLGSGAGNINDRWREGVGIFAVTGGTVTTAGALNFQGLQFIVNGYTVNGPGTLNMTGDVPGGTPTQSFINVEGAGNTATVNAVITSNAGVGLSKAGAGTLVLGGANTYDGGTTVTAGTLALTGAGTLGAVTGATTVNGASAILNLGGTTQTQATVSLVDGSIQNGTLNATTSFTQSGGNLSGVNATTPLYTLSGGTMAGNVTATTQYNQSGGTTSGNVTTPDYNLSGGTLTGTANGGTFDLTGTGSVSAAGAINIAAGGAVTQNGAGTTMSGTVHGAGGTGNAPLYTLIAGTMDGTVNATAYNQSGGVTSGTANAGTANQSGGTVASAGVVNATTYNQTNGSMAGTVNGTDYNLSGGTLASGGEAWVTTFAQTGGSMEGFVNADTYNLGGGTLAASGTAQADTFNQTNGTMAGSVLATNYNLSGGTLASGGDASVTTFAQTGGLMAGHAEADTYNLSGGTLAASGTAQAGTFNQTNGTMAGGVLGTNYNLSGGTLAAGGDASVTTFKQSGGVMAGTAEVTTYQLTGGTLSGAASATTLFDMRAGSVTGHLTNTAQLVKSGAGTVTLSGANSYTGGTTVSAGTLALAGAGTLGDTGNSTTVNGASAVLDLGGTTQTQDAATLTDGTIQNGTFTLTTYNQAGGTLAADATVNASSAFNLTDGGTVAGVLAGSGALVKTGAGTATLTGVNTYTGNTTVSAGILDLVGTGSLSSPDITVDGTGKLRTDGHGLAGAPEVHLAGTGNLTLTGVETIGSLDGTAATTVALGSTLTTGGNNASTTFDGVMSGAGGLTKVGTGTFTLTGANTFTGTTGVNAGTLMLDGGSLAGPASVLSDAVLGLNAGSVGGLVSVADGGTLHVYDGSSVGGLALKGTLDMRNNHAGDRLTVNGNLQADPPSMVLETDLSGAVGRSDNVFVTGNSSGAANVTFVDLGNAAGLQNNPTVVLHANGNNDVDLTNVNSDFSKDSVIQYRLQQDPSTRDWVILSSVNVDAVAGLASSITTAQSLIGNIISRPASAFVSGLAQADPDTCGFSPWLRGTGGAAKGSTESSSRGISATTEATMRYGGAQASFDFGCNNIGAHNLSVNAGLTFGMNNGTTHQDQISDFSGTRVLTDTQFNNRFIGGYATMNKGRFSAELQGRIDLTDFDVTSSLLGTTAGTTGTVDNVGSRRYSLSGSASYSFALKDGWQLDPTVGFSLARTKTDTINRGSLKLEFDPVISVVGFTGVTLSKFMILPDQESAIQPFVTATLYNDFASDSHAYFTAQNTGAAAQAISTENLGTYGELSIGASYLKIYNEQGFFGPAKQLSASIRGDFRYGDRVKAAGVTAQVRLQF